MSYIGDSRRPRGPGFLPLQDWDPSKRDDPDERTCLLAVRIAKRQRGAGLLGSFEEDPDARGDLHGGMFWPAADGGRPTGMWRFCFPATTRRGGGGSGVGQTQAAPGVGATFTDASQGPDANAQAFGFTSHQTDFSHPATPGVPNAQTSGGGSPAAGPAGEPVATGGGRRCPTLQDSARLMLPVRGDGWDPDSRFKQLKAAAPDGPDGEPLWRLPLGTYGIALQSQDEDRQIEYFLPTDPRLVAVNHDGDPRTASRVYDLTDRSELDPKRGARLQSMMWVVKKPLGAENAIAWTVGESGCEDVGGGYITDKASDAGGQFATVGNTQAGGEEDRAFARMSRHNGGPLDVGSSDDEHKLGEDDDGNAINSAHIWTGALFRRSKPEDGPLLFEGLYKDGDDLDKIVPVHLTWDGGSKHWRWYTTSPIS